MSDYMVLIQAARKAEGEHKQEKHNNSCASKSGVVTDAPMGNEENTNPDSEATAQEPWAKWIEMQQQFDSSMAAVKGAQKALQKPPNRDPTRDQEIAIKVSIPMARDPTGKVVTKLAMQPEAIKIRLGGNDWSQIQCYNCQGWSICIMSAPVPQMHDL